MFFFRYRIMFLRPQEIFVNITLIPTTFIGVNKVYCKVSVVSKIIKLNPVRRLSNIDHHEWILPGC